MSRFLSARYRDLIPYVPGEQPAGRTYIKLNTNESPFPVDEEVLKEAFRKCRPFQLYSDPESAELRQAMGGVYGLSGREVLACNGSDEALNLAFMTFCDEETPALFPDVTYGFYRVAADANRVPYEEVPLREDFSLALSDYEGKRGTLFLANPNAPTGMAVARGDIEQWLSDHPDILTVVDEAYVDFGSESCAPLVRKYPNLLVVQTFSKSRSLAGARLGFAFGGEDLIRDLNTLRNAVAPYNVNSMTQALGLEVLKRQDQVKERCRVIGETRSWTENMLRALGFFVLPSRTNFVFARSDRMSGEALYIALREKGILVRHFDSPRIRDYNRISIGTMEQMEALKRALTEILSEGRVPHAEK